LYPDGFAAYSAADVNIETEEVIAVSSQSSEQHRLRKRVDEPALVVIR